MPSQQQPQMSQDVEYLQSLKSIRDRCEQIYERVKSGHPEARFDLDEGKLNEIADYVAEIIKKDYVDPAHDVPPHSRWRHFLPKGSIESSVISPLKFAGADNVEIVKSVLDLFVVSVLLDAGAGDKWKYKREGIEEAVGRSEGLAMASMDMFIKGLFSNDGDGDGDGDGDNKGLKVDADALIELKLKDLEKGLQVEEKENPLIGLNGRLDLLKSLGRVLKKASNTQFFFNPVDSSNRPGNLVHFLLKNSNENGEIGIGQLWKIVVEGFGGVWPEEGRIKIGNVCLGDVWESKILEGCETKGDHDKNNENNIPYPNTKNLVTFHKLSQWLSYSLLEPIEKYLNLKFTEKAQMTGLAEYRNGGLFVDLGALKLKEEYKNERNEFKPNDEVIIQWRAMTICLLDHLAPLLRAKLNVSKEEFSLPKMLEGGTWKAGRIIAKTKRPETSGPPIKIISDGTLF